MSMSPPPQTLRGVYPELGRRAQGDMGEETFEAKPYRREGAGMESNPV